MISRASGGVSKREHAKNFCLCRRTGGLLEGRESTSNENTSLLISSQQLLSSYTERELEGKKGTLQ